MFLLERDLVSCAAPNDERFRVSFLGHPLAHPIGLAAGFDKDGVAIDAWESVGFSFLEVGTVTPKAQSGNERPRLFRLPEDEGLVNRMGFNNRGVEALAANLARREARTLIGANIGVNKQTPRERAYEEYGYCAERLWPHCDYLAINVSSPNTPGLRDLQEAESLSKIVATVRSIAKTTPAFVKLSPDLYEDSLRAIIDASLSHGATGFIVTNTTVSREGLKSANAAESGGVSGRPLTRKANQVCRTVRQHCGPGVPIIGVGGIFTGADLFERLRSGATVCQIYTAFVYRGPCAVRLILEEAAEEMERHGASSLAEIGT